MLTLLVILLIVCRDLASTADTRDWKRRSIYQVSTDRFARTDGSTTANCSANDTVACGGSWRGIINNLNYIQGMGFDAIMISPVNQHANGTVRYGDAYQGYWPKSLYELDENFGTREDLLDLSQALHDRDMYLMVDIVLNNMTYHPAKAVNHTDLPFDNAKYPQPYCVITDRNNSDTTQKCWAGDKRPPLPTPSIGNNTVAQMMKTWVKNLVSTYSIDGLRINAVKYVDKDYLKEFVNASSVFATGELFKSKQDVACDYQHYIPGLPNYSIYYALIEAFGKGNMTALPRALDRVAETCRDPFALGAFSENRDLPQFASFSSDLSLAKNVIAFTILSDGIPMYYQGQEQHLSGDRAPTNHEALWLSKYNISAPLYQFTAMVNKLRQQAIRIDDDYLEQELYPLSVEDGISSFRKGYQPRQVITVYSNHGENGGHYDFRIPRIGTENLILTEITTCTNYTTDTWGALNLVVENGLPKIFFPADQMGGSGLCSVGNWPARGSKKVGGGKSPSDKQHWEVTEIDVNPKWGRRPGRLGSRPTHSVKHIPKQSGCGKMQCPWLQCLVSSMLVVLGRYL
ncbi:hypothetical protein LOZ12_004387 [Ophidiomyces ophidiicola]|nr:hypothetical protein LOZ62_006551 [Ophidiomyces ophidiicola]KAI2042332.1 hypothetical protein LOZ44_006183 [Ophidiomyces ophidiicola]KAI2052046.1 hypothetical protein LOZ38_002385 [Ophidiomyces ophidiicola]KAI2077567.1 hypothetical protein LOZ39_002132 [Ophidiomyces ophidiicola]KAI2081662.1 hypothetical protein LOZ37_001194 [Ophidiomyces ophidiicola]